MDFSSGSLLQCGLTEIGSRQRTKLVRKHYAKRQRRPADHSVEMARRSDDQFQIFTEDKIEKVFPPHFHNAGVKAVSTNFEVGIARKQRGNGRGPFLVGY